MIYFHSLMILLSLTKSHASEINDMLYRRAYRTPSGDSKEVFRGLGILPMD